MTFFIARTFCQPCRYIPKQPKNTEKCFQSTLLNFNKNNTISLITIYFDNPKIFHFVYGICGTQPKFQLYSANAVNEEGSGEPPKGRQAGCVSELANFT